MERRVLQLRRRMVDRRGDWHVPTPPPGIAAACWCGNASVAGGGGFSTDWGTLPPAWQATTKDALAELNEVQGFVAPQAVSHLTGVPADVVGQTGRGLGHGERLAGRRWAYPDVGDDAQHDLMAAEALNQGRVVEVELLGERPRLVEARAKGHLVAGVVHEVALPVAELLEVLEGEIQPAAVLAGLGEHHGEGEGAREVDDVGRLVDVHVERPPLAGRQRGARKHRLREAANQERADEPELVALGKSDQQNLAAVHALVEVDALGGLAKHGADGLPYQQRLHLIHDRAHGFPTLARSHVLVVGPNVIED